jgi:hypothetical protein
MTRGQYEHWRLEALDLLSEARSTLQRNDRGRAADEVQDARDQLSGGKVTAAVFGEFKRGKSRLSVHSSNPPST